MTEKDMSTKYDPAAVEEGRYQWWIDQGFFENQVVTKQAHPYSIVIPPPNITGGVALRSCLGYNFTV